MKKLIAIAAMLSVSSFTFAFERGIELEGATNFRDIGGYENIHGETVITDTIYRSGELPRLTENDIAVLGGLEINTVVNFLTLSELEARGYDRLPEGVQTTFLPISGGNDHIAETVLEARRTGDFSNVPVSLNAEMHRILVGESTQQEYADFLRHVANSDNHPVVYHCSHGVHRTGTATAILLSALEVPWETIRNDYLLSNTYRAEENSARLAQLQELAAKTLGVAVEDVDTTNMEAFYLLEAEYINATLEEVLVNYGTMENYIIEGLGLSFTELQKLRQVMLK